MKMLSKKEFKKEDLLSALQELDCSRNCPCCEYFSPDDIQKCQDPTPYAVDLLEEFIQEHFELVEGSKRLKKALDNAIKQCCIGVTGSDACNSLDELYKAFEKKVWEDVE